MPNLLTFSTFVGKLQLHQPVAWTMPYWNHHRERWGGGRAVILNQRSQLVLTAFHQRFEKPFACLSTNLSQSWYNAVYHREYFRHPLRMQTFLWKRSHNSHWRHAHQEQTTNKLECCCFSIIVWFSGPQNSCADVEGSFQNWWNSIALDRELYLGKISATYVKLQVI